MKRNVLFWTAVMVCMLGLNGCGGNREITAAESGKQAESAAEDPGKETTPKREADGIHIRFDEMETEYTAEDGTVLARVRRRLPAVTIADAQNAAAVINEAVQNYGKSETEEGDLMGASGEEIKKWAKEDYELRGKENWHAYETDTTFTSRRTDSRVISFYIDSYWDMGGAHPSTFGNALNFNAETGERLTLKDVTENEQEAVAYIKEFILEETKKKKYEGMFFEGYESSIGDLLTEDTWYLGEDGFHVIGNEYIISPHAAGMFDFVIPYEKAEFLKAEYRL